MSVPTLGEGTGFFGKNPANFFEPCKDSFMWQFTYLLIHPDYVFRQIRTHRHEYGRWARTNYQFIIIESILVFLFMGIWSVFYSFNFVKTLLFFVLDYIVFGIILSTIIWFILNKWCISIRSYRESKQDVEWRFCVDAYCNGYIAILIDFLIGLLPTRLITYFWANTFTEKVLPNLIFFFAISHFVYLFNGTLEILPYTKHARFTFLLIPIVCLGVLALIFGWPVAFGWLQYRLG